MGWQSCAVHLPCGCAAREHYLGRLDGAAAPLRYTGLVRRAVLRAKYQGAPWAAVELGVEMAAPALWQRDQNARL